MYEAYWGLSEPPFDNSPNPKFFYLSPEHEEALVRLVYTVRHRKGCGMLTGEYGCGKTTLSRALIQRLEAERYEIGLLTNPRWNATDFLREALYQLGVETPETSKAELLHRLHDVFFGNFREGRDTVVGYLTAAFTVLGPALAYEREWLGEDSAVLQFRTEVGGLEVSGIDMITWDSDGQIVDFTVMVRPAKALQAVIEHMGAELLRMLEAADRTPA